MSDRPANAGPLAYAAPQHFLYFLPLLQGQGSLRPTLGPRLRIGSTASRAMISRNRRRSSPSNPGDPSAVELSWSGAHDAFEVYRGVSAQKVLDPTNLFTQTFLCAVSDDRALASNIIFYNVIPQSQN